MSSTSENTLKKFYKEFQIEIITFIVLVILTIITDLDKQLKDIFHDLGTDAILGIFFGLTYKTYTLHRQINKVLKQRILPIPDYFNEIKGVDDTVSLIYRIFQALGEVRKDKQELHTKLTNLILARNFNQISTSTSTGKVEFIASSIDDQPIKDFLSYCANKSSMIKATCITPMDSFWFNVEIGPKFLTMNLEYMQKHEFKIERTFLVQDSDWKNNEVVKRELIKLMRRNKIQCFEIEESELESKKSIKDYFIFYTNENVPFVALEWNVDYERRPNKITLIYEQKELEDINREFLKELFPTHPEPINFDEDILKYLPTKIDHCQNYIESLCTDKLNTNSTNYLINRLVLSEDNISIYWNNLKNTIVRPSDNFSICLRNELNKMEKKENLKIGILGCTPEAFQVANSVCKNSTIFFIDLSSEMYRGMLKFSNEYSNDDFSQNNNTVVHIEYNWLALYLIPVETKFLLDIVIGVDVLNMLPNSRHLPDFNNNQSLFFKGIKHITSPHSKILLQTLCYGSNIINKKNTQQNKSDQIGDLIKKEQNPTNCFFDEQFVKLALNSGHGICEIDLPTTYSKVITEWDNHEDVNLKNFSDYVKRTYTLCNSKLNLFHKEHIKDKLSIHLSANGLSLDKILQLKSENNYGSEFMYLTEFAHK